MNLRISPLLVLRSVIVGRYDVFRRFSRGLAVVAALVVAACPAAAQSWNLADDWSDSMNPNGVWSYNGAPDVPIETSIEDWDPTNDIFSTLQPAWAAAEYPLNDHVPMWFKRISDDASIDVPIGDVGTHGNEYGDPNVWVGVSWTSPLEAAIDVTGAVWYAHISVQRSASWRVRLNDAPLTGGSVSWDDPYSSESPFQLIDGSGGPSALGEIQVLPGDRITLEFLSAPSVSCFCGVELNIAVHDPQNPCPADVNNDDKVNIDDLFQVLSAWGPCDACPEDINDDGVVNIDDIFEVLAVWGPCP